MGATTISESLAAVLAERYDCMSRALVPPVYNARRVTVRGKACVAKLIFYPEDDGEGGAFNKRRKAGFAMEKYVYPRLRGWPVKLVDSFSSRAGDVVVTSGSSPMSKKPEWAFGSPVRNTADGRSFK